MNRHDEEKIRAFFAQQDEAGVTNLEKARQGRTIRRVAETDKSKSYEEAADSPTAGDLPRGVVEAEGRFIGLGIHIFNADVYPLQSFEITLRNCDLTGTLDLAGCADLIFLDLYNNRIEAVDAAGLTAMRIFGLQNNALTALDPTGMPVCQGIDVGKNRLRTLDVSRNPELVELYVNDNAMRSIDLSRNPKLKYFYCHNNRLTRLDTTANPLLRHLNATGNPLREIRALAPQREEPLPLTVLAGAGGTVGLKFNPVYNAQWKETGEWQQSCYAYPEAGMEFEGWYDEAGRCIGREPVRYDAYGTAGSYTAVFAEKRP